MELKLQHRRPAEALQESSNRTFMELKSGQRGWLQDEKCVLIVPLWN